MTDSDDPRASVTRCALRPSVSAVRNRVRVREMPPRKLRDLSMRERKELLVCYDGGKLERISQPRAAAILNVTYATLKRLLNGRRAIEAHRETTSASRRARRTAAENLRFMDVEKGLLRWFRDAQAHRLPVNEAVLLAKAGELAARLGVADFTANLTWIVHWKYKYNVTDKEVGRVAHCGARNRGWAPPEGMCRYDADDVYSLVETGFFYLSRGSGLVHRLSVVLACNVTGTDRLKPLVVTNDRDPWFSRHVQPLLDAGDGGRWTTGDLASFVERWDRAVWPRRVLVVLDRCLALPPGVRPRNVEVARFPAAADHHHHPHHPLGSHVIRNAAAYEFYARQTLPPAGHVTVLDFVHLLSDVWANVPPPLVRNCFRALGWTGGTGVEQVRENVRADFERWTARHRGSPVEPSDDVPVLNANGRENCISVPTSAATAD